METPQNFFRNLNWGTSPGDNFLKHLPMVRQNIDIKLMVTISILIKIPIMYCRKKKTKKKEIKINICKLSWGLAGSCSHQKAHLNLPKAGNHNEESLAINHAYRSGSRAAATSKMERFGIIVNLQQP